MNTTIVPVIDLPFLAREINDAHRQVQFHGKSMLMEAKRAGEALLEARRKFPSKTEFGHWRAANTGIKHRNTATQYMAVARKWADAHCDVHQADFAEMSIRQFLEVGSIKPEPPTPREFTREDAERALKFHALATRGATEGEQAAASSKLASFAKEFGMTPEAMADKAKVMFPDVEKTEGEARREKAEAGWKDAAARLAKHDAIAARLRAEFAKATKEDLIDVLAGALMRLEEAGLG